MSNLLLTDILEICVDSLMGSIINSRKEPIIGIGIKNGRIRKGQMTKNNFFCGAKFESNIIFKRFIKGQENK